MICQLIYARSNPAFSFKKNNNGEIHFKTDDAAGLGWYNVSEKLLKDYVWLIEASEGFSVDKIRSVSRNSSENVSEVNSSYTCLKLKDDVFALIYQFTQNDSRATSVARHILIGNFPDNINITNLLSKELPCWKATQGPEVNFYDKNADRERLPALHDSFLSVPPDSEQEIFDFINKNPEFYKKILCFLIEHLSNADGLNKTLLIRDTQENMILWVKAISYFLPLELRKNFTFSTNITELYEEQQSRLSDVKNNNRLYFAVAGIHPEDRSCAGIAEENKMYSLADIGKGRFTYSHEYLNCSFFEDLLIRGKISSFYSDIWSKINKKINVVEYYEIYSNKDKLHSLGYEKVRIILEILNKNKESYIDFKNDILDAAEEIYNKFNKLEDDVDVEKNLSLLFALQDYDSKFDVCDVIKKFVCSKKDEKFISYETAKRLFTGDTSVLSHISKDKLKDLFNNFAYTVLKHDVSYLKQDLKEKFVLFNVIVANCSLFRESVSNNLKTITQEYVNDIKQLTQLISDTPEDYKKAVYETFAENIQQNNNAKYAWIAESLTHKNTYNILVGIGSQTKFDLKQAILEYQGHIVEISNENGKEIEGFFNKIKENPYLLSYLPDLKKNLIAVIPGIDHNLKTDFLVDYFCNYRKEAEDLTGDDKEKEDRFIRYIFSKSGEEEKDNYFERIKESAPDKKDLLKKIFLNKKLSDLIDKKNYKAVLKIIQNDKDSAEFFFGEISSKTEFYGSADDLDILNKYLEDVYIKYAKKDKKVIYPEAIQPLLRGFKKFGLEEVFKVLNIFRKNNVTLAESIYDEYSNPSVKIFEHCEAYSECITFFSGADENYVKKFCENLCDYALKPNNERLRIFHSCYEAVRNVKCGEEKGEKIFEKALKEKYIPEIEKLEDSSLKTEIEKDFKESLGTKIKNSVKNFLIRHRDDQKDVEKKLKGFESDKKFEILIKQIRQFRGE